jgi:hypothetical protein
VATIPGKTWKPGKAWNWAIKPGKPGKWHFFPGKQRVKPGKTWKITIWITTTKIQPTKCLVRFVQCLLCSGYLTTDIITFEHAVSYRVPKKLAIFPKFTFFLSEIIL